jgi:membrane protease YdiL (CAAX protease family)
MFLEAIRDHQGRFQRRCPFTAPNGRTYTFFVTSSQLSYGEGESYVVVTCADVTAEVEAERMRHESTFVLLSSIVYICLFIFVYSVWNFVGRPGAPSDLTRVLEVGGVVLGVFVYKNTSLTLGDLGLSTRNLAHNLKVDVLACLGVVAFFALAKVFFMFVAPQVIVHPEVFYDPSWLTPGRALAYVFTALIQEFLTRGIMQESLTHVIAHEKRESIAIVISTLMFAAIHLHYGPYFMMGAAVLLGVFGVIYRKQRSIWGLVLIHFTFGMSAAFLGLI